MDNYQPHQLVAIRTVRLALPADLHPDEISDGISSLLSEIGIGQGMILDWAYELDYDRPEEMVVKIGAEPVEGCAFTAADNEDDVFEKQAIEMRMASPRPVEYYELYDEWEYSETSGHYNRGVVQYIADQLRVEYTDAMDTTGLDPDDFEDSRP